MRPIDTTRILLAVIATLLVVIALELRTARPPAVYADSSRFDHVQIVATSFVFGGNTGLLALDKRNGNVWFIPRGQDMEKTWFKDPVFVIRVPFEKLDQPPPTQ
jgi:hypothetical protein